jgi:hypothetical protein
VNLVLTFANIDGLIELKESLNLQSGFAKSLDAKLNAAKTALEKGHEKTAINHLNSFINRVETQTEKKIMEEQAMQLISCAQAVIKSIE